MTYRSAVLRLLLTLFVLSVAGCAPSRGIPLCSDEGREALLSEIQEGDRLLTEGDTTGAWWAYVHSTVGFTDRAVCRDRLMEPGEFGRALAFAAEHAYVYTRDSSSVSRRGHWGPTEYYVDGVRLDSHVVALHEIGFPQSLGRVDN